MQKTNRTGPIIRFLGDSIRQLGGNISGHNIYCRRCTQRKAGGFDPEYGIQICANEMRDQGHLEDTLAHEMVHAYDHLRFKLDWTDNLRHAACTEVCGPCWECINVSNLAHVSIDPGQFIEWRVPMGTRIF
jgi:hypothetical protein